LLRFENVNYDRLFTAHLEKKFYFSPFQNKVFPVYNLRIRELLQDGSFSFRDPIEIPGRGSSFFVFGAAWLLEILDLGSGEFFFMSDGREVRPRGRRFGVYYPPFTIVNSCVNEMKGTVIGCGGIGDPPAGLPGFPVIFETAAFDGELSSAGQAVEVFQAGSESRSIEFNSRVSLLSLKAKKLIDENYRIYPSIARIAARLQVSHEHLSRQFKRDFGMSPSGYLHKLRVADATHRLSLGEEIIDISQDVGYNDLSRFYKQFRKATKTSPGDCRVTLNKRG
jgi:AraC-like DNA-binding protein